MSIAALLLSCALAPATTAHSPAPDDLLPATPAGWRYEKLDLPLTFAPDLPYAGFEELRFAPGMFTEGAPDYWSYALALRTQTPVHFDAARIEEFLVAYYAGLCEAVAEGRGIAFERDSLKLTLADHGDVYIADVEMIDAFVTGGPLTLRLELSVHAGPDTTELFGIASPADPDAAVWKDLRAIRARWRAERDPVAFLNHLFVVPDAETYAALREAPFLQSGFLAREVRTTKRPDLSYTGLYFYGRETYFEFLEPGSAANIQVGASGIALGLETPGATARVKQALAAVDIECFDGPRSRSIAGQADPVPWFRIMGLQQAHERARLNVFTMEYDPAYLAGWHPDRAPAHPGISRRQVLERYAAALGESEGRDAGLALDVSEVFLELDAAEQAQFRKACEALHYEVTGDADAWVARGPRITFAVRASEDPGRITGFRLALRRAVETETLRFGKASLELRDKTATFQFQQ